MTEHSSFEVAGASIELWPQFLANPSADELFRQLRDEIPWRELASRWLGPVPRRAAWYADDAATYEYSGVTMVAETATPPSLARARTLVEQQLAIVFPFALVTLYRDGRDSVGWHADDEELFGGDPVVASLSLGAARRFEVKAKPDLEAGPTGEPSELELVLRHASLLVMWPPMQQRCLHRVPKAPDPGCGERINVTLRSAGPMHDRGKPMSAP